MHAASRGHRRPALHWLFLVAWLALGCAARETVSIGKGEPSSVDASADGGRVLGFVLVDVKTRIDVRMLIDGDTIDTQGDPVTIRAVVEPLDPGSVVFTLDGAVVRIEENPPWMIAGNDPTTGAPFVWKVALGVHRVKATPRSAPGGGGMPGASLEQTFTIQ